MKTPFSLAFLKYFLPSFRGVVRGVVQVAQGKLNHVQTRGTYMAIPAGPTPLGPTTLRAPPPTGQNRVQIRPARRC